MPSGKQSKRRRREEFALVHPPSRHASPRVLLAAVAIIALIGGAAALAFALTGTSSSAGSTRATSVPGAADVRAMLAGIPQHGNALGSPRARVTIVAYVDLQCPYCQQFETQAMPRVIERYVRTGKARIEIRTLAFLGPDSARGRSAVIAAGMQNRFFDVLQLLYVNQGAENSGWLREDLLAAVAASLHGLDRQRFADDRRAAAVGTEAQRLDASATSSGVHSTPTIFVGRTASDALRVTLQSPTDGATVAKAVDALLRR